MRLATVDHLGLTRTMMKPRTLHQHTRERPASDRPLQPATKLIRFDATEARRRTVSRVWRHASWFDVIQSRWRRYLLLIRYSIFAQSVLFGRRQERRTESRNPGCRNAVGRTPDGTMILGWGRWRDITTPQGPHLSMAVLLWGLSDSEWQYCRRANLTGKLFQDGCPVLYKPSCHRFIPPLRFGPGDISCSHPCPPLRGGVLPYVCYTGAFAGCSGRSATGVARRMQCFSPAMFYFDDGSKYKK